MGAMDDSSISRGSPAAFAWTLVAGAVQYLVEFTGGPDPGMIGGGFVVPTNGVAGTVPLGIPIGAYRIRILGLTGTGAPLGQFSPTLTIVIQ